MSTDNQADLWVKGIEDFISRYLTKSEHEGVVLGLSGGVDSAVCAALAINALGMEKVHILWLPYYDNDDLYLDDSYVEDSGDAYEIARHLGLKIQRISIQKAVLGCSQFGDMKWGYKSAYDVKNSHANIKSRIRMTVLYDYAYAHNLLVMNTSNKSEIMVGYGTKWGDTVGDIAPIADMYKTEVYRIARCLELPQLVIDKAPSAGMYADQTDEEEIGMSYAVLDKILAYLQDEHRIGGSQRKKTRDTYGDLIDKVRDKIALSEHKRRARVSKYPTWYG